MTERVIMITLIAIVLGIRTGEELGINSSRRRIRIPNWGMGAITIAIVIALLAIAYVTAPLAFWGILGMAGAIAIILAAFEKFC